MTTIKFDEKKYIKDILVLVDIKTKDNMNYVLRRII